MKRCVADTKVIWLFIHGLGSRVRAPETTDLVEGGVVTEKPTTPEDTREHHTQYNRPRETPLVGRKPDLRSLVEREARFGTTAVLAPSRGRCRARSVFVLWWMNKPCRAHAPVPLFSSSRNM